LKAPERVLLLFHLGLALFFLLPAVLLLLLLRTLGAGPATAVLAGVSLLLISQLTAFLYRIGHRGSSGGRILRLSYLTLKLLQAARMLPEYAPEKMVIAMNNRRILGKAGGFRPERTLILLPHCLQDHTCPIRLTFDPDACRRCGRCPVAGLLEVRDRYGTELAIVSGGTAARKVVRETRPDLIVAVACPVDLSLGILDVSPIPVVGVLNQWINGPCFDTWVDPAELEAALALFLSGPAADSGAKSS